jgi:hypothetical protein
LQSFVGLKQDYQNLEQDLLRVVCPWGEGVEEKEPNKFKLPVRVRKPIKAPPPREQEPSGAEARVADRSVSRRRKIGIGFACAFVVLMGLGTRLAVKNRPSDSQVRKKPDAPKSYHTERLEKVVRVVEKILNDKVWRHVQKNWEHEKAFQETMQSEDSEAKTGALKRIAAYEVYEAYRKALGAECDTAFPWQEYKQGDAYDYDRLNAKLKRLGVFNHALEEAQKQIRAITAPPRKRQETPPSRKKYKDAQKKHTGHSPSGTTKKKPTPPIQKPTEAKVD